MQTNKWIRRITDANIVFGYRQRVLDENIDTFTDASINRCIHTLIQRWILSYTAKETEREWERDQRSKEKMQRI